MAYNHPSTGKQITKVVESDNAQKNKPISITPSWWSNCTKTTQDIIFGVIVTFFTLLWIFWLGEITLKSFFSNVPWLVENGKPKMMLYLLSDFFGLGIGIAAYKMFFSSIKSEGLMAGFITILFISAISHLIWASGEIGKMLPKNKEKDASVCKIDNIINVYEPRTILLVLDSYQEFPSKIHVGDGLKITFNSPKGTDFFITMHERNGIVKHMIKDDEPLPKPIGTFSIRNGEKKCKIMVLIY